MRVGRHVVEPRPRPNHRRAGRGRIPARKALAPVRDELLVDLLALGPARRRLVHRQAERVAAPPEVEPRLGLEDHRQVVRDPRDRAHVDELAAERADRKAGPELRRERTGCDHENLPVELARITALANFDPPLRRPPDELPRHLGGLGDPVLPAGDRSEHVVRAQALDLGKDRRARRERRGHAGAPPGARASRAPPRSSRRTGSRPGRRTAARAPGRSRSTRGRAAPLPRSRTVAARRPSPSPSIRRRLGRGRRARRRPLRAARAGRRCSRRSRRRRL